MIQSESEELTRIRVEYAARGRRLAGKDTYSPFNPGHLFLLQRRQRAVLYLLRQYGLWPMGERRILEVGCGNGGVLHEYLGYGARPELMTGMDLLLDRVRVAKSVAPHISVMCADGQHLPYLPEAFDLVVQYTVFSSIMDDRVRRNVANEMLRVLKPGGVVLWYDFLLNPSNRQTKGIGRREILRLFPGCAFTFKRVTLAPPLARRVARRSWMLCELLENLGVLNTHYLAAGRRITGSAALQELRP